MPFCQLRPDVDWHIFILKMATGPKMEVRKKSMLGSSRSDGMESPGRNLRKWHTVRLLTNSLVFPESHWLFHSLRSGVARKVLWFQTPTSRDFGGGRGAGPNARLDGFFRQGSRSDFQTSTSLAVEIKGKEKKSERHLKEKQPSLKEQQNVVLTSVVTMFSSTCFFVSLVSFSSSSFSHYDYYFLLVILLSYF